MAADAAFEAIYNATRRQTLVYLTAKCGDPADLQDLFQDTYAELYAVLRRRGGGYVRDGAAFVRKLARQQLHRHYSRRALRRDVSLEELEGGVPAPPEEIDDRLVTQELLDQVRAALARKPALTRKIFCLHFALGLTLGETAQALEVSESFVKNRLYRTIAQLRQELKLDEKGGCL